MTTNFIVGPFKYIPERRSSPFRPVRRTSTLSRPLLDKTLSEHIKECERNYIVAALVSTRGNLAHAAILLGRNRTELYRKMQSCGIVLLKRNIK